MSNHPIATNRDGIRRFENYLHASSYTGYEFVDEDNDQQLLPPFEESSGTGLGTICLYCRDLAGTQAWIIERDNYSQELATPQVAAPEVRSTSEQVRFIQASLGLTVAQMASVLGVKRQTIYNWMQAEHETVLQARTRARLEELGNIARIWNQHSSRPAGKLIASIDIGGTTLLNLLTQKHIDMASVEAVMEVLSNQIAETVRQRRERIKTKQSPPETDDDRILRRATGIQLDATES